MSVQAMTWALTQRLVTDASARHVLLCLANYADKDGRGAFPSANSLAEDTGLAVRTVRYKLEQLQECGAIRLGNQAIAAAYIDRGDRRPVVYDLAMERGASAAPRTERPATVAPREHERGANDDTTGCNLQHNGVQMTTERGATVAPNPSLNHQVTKEQGASAPRAAKKFDPVTACPPNVSPKVWADWCQHRREIRKPLKETSCVHQARQLAGHPHADTVITNSIANSWTGLFPEKVSHASSTQSDRPGPLSAVDRVKVAIAAREAGAAAAGQAVAEDGGALRQPLDGEFRRVG